MVNREGYRTEDEALKRLDQLERMKSRGQVKDYRRGSPWREGRFTIEVIL